MWSLYYDLRTLYQTPKYVEKCFFLPLNGSNSHVKYDFLTPGGLMYSLIQKSVPDDISKKRRRLVFKTGVIIYIQNYTKNQLKIFLSINLHIFYICYDINKHNMNFFCEFDRQMTNETAFAPNSGYIEYYGAPELEGSGTLF